MEMTLDEAIEGLQSEVNAIYETLDIWSVKEEKEKSIEYGEQLKVAISIMHKYQKIEKIVKAWNDMNSFDSMKQISEVMNND